MQKIFCLWLSGWGQVFWTSAANSSPTATCVIKITKHVWMNIWVGHFPGWLVYLLKLKLPNHIPLCRKRHLILLPCYSTVTAFQLHRWFTFTSSFLNSIAYKSIKILNSYKSWNHDQGLQKLGTCLSVGLMSHIFFIFWFWEKIQMRVFECVYANLTTLFTTTFDVLFDLDWNWLSLTIGIRIYFAAATRYPDWRSGWTATSKL